MAAFNGVRSEGFACASVFVGSAALVAWVGHPALVVLQGHNPLAYIVWSTFLFPVAPIFAALGLWWGLRILRGSPNRRKRLLQALLPVAIMSPALGYFGMMLPWTSYVWFSNTFLRDPTPIMYTPSPDGRYAAWIEKKMTPGGWGQKYLVQSVADDQPHVVGGTGDYNRAKRIHWSPDSRIAIFEKDSDLIAVRLRDYKTQAVNLEYIVDAQGFCQMRPLEKIDFPKTGFFVIHYSDGTASKTIDMGN